MLEAVGNMIIKKIKKALNVIAITYIILIVIIIFWTDVIAVTYY